MEIVVTVMLVLLATVLMTAEIVFVPGVGISGVLGVLAMLSAVVYAFYCVGNIAGWITIIVLGFILVALFMWALYGKTLDKMALKKNISSKVENFKASDFKPGDRGVAKTRLTLIGEALINGQVVEVKSETGFINEKDEIEVVRVTAGTIYVKKVGEE